MSMQEFFERMAQDVTAVAFAGGLTVDHHRAVKVRQIEVAPVFQGSTQNDAGIPGTVDDQGARIGFLVNSVAVLDQLERGHDFTDSGAHVRGSVAT